MNQEKIGKFIAECRKQKNMTQEELAEKLGITGKSISRWENGRNMPDLSLFKPLCDELDITINDLLSGEKVEKEIYQNKLEENIIEIIYSYIKDKTKKIIKLTFKIILVLIILLIGLLCVNEYIQRPVYLKEENIDIKICDYNDKHIALSIITNDGYAASFNVSKKDNAYYISKVYRKWIETKKLSLLENYINDITLLKKDVKQIYYDNKLIWDTNMNISICGLD